MTRRQKGPEMDQSRFLHYHLKVYFSKIERVSPKLVLLKYTVGNADHISSKQVLLYLNKQRNDDDQ